MALLFVLFLFIGIPLLALAALAVQYLPYTLLGVLLRCLFDERRPTWSHVWIAVEVALLVAIAQLLL